MALMKTFIHFEYINYGLLFRQKMSWFKKLYSSQETKVVYENKGGNEKESTQEQEAVLWANLKLTKVKKALALKVAGFLGVD